jgi:hypothetical protein
MQTKNTNSCDLLITQEELIAYRNTAEALDKAKKELIELRASLRSRLRSGAKIEEGKLWIWLGTNSGGPYVDLWGLNEKGEKVSLLDLAMGSTASFPSD